MSLLAPFSSATAVHPHSPSPNWAIVSSQSQRDNMAEESSNPINSPSLCHLRCREALQRWTRVVLIQGLEENSLLFSAVLYSALHSSPNPVHSYSFRWLSRVQSVCDWWACLTRRLPARGLEGERNYNTRFLWHSVNGMYTQKYSLSVVITRRGSNFALWLIKAANVNKQGFFFFSRIA